MNPKVSQLDFQQSAKENIQRLAHVEREVFAFYWQEGKPAPKYPRYWDVREDETVPIFLRYPRLSLATVAVQSPQVLPGR